MRPVRRMLVNLLVGVAVAYLGLCAALFLFQRSLIYFPQPTSIREPEGTAVLTLESDAERVLVSTRETDGQNALIYFGGNAEDVSFSMAGFSTAFPGHAIYLLHYRGYGGSSGSPSEAALFRDSLSLFDKVHAQHPNVVV